MNRLKMKALFTDVVMHCSRFDSNVGSWCLLQCFMSTSRCVAERSRRASAGRCLETWRTAWWRSVSTDLWLVLNKKHIGQWLIQMKQGAARNSKSQHWNKIKTESFALNKMQIRCSFTYANMTLCAKPLFFMHWLILRLLVLVLLHFDHLCL